jgi:glycosyltransferase involved in cell wall biosynthesis
MYCVISISIEIVWFFKILMSADNVFVMQEKVSIIIPARNEGENLRKTVDSINRVTEYPNYEIVVVDDASTDGCCEFLGKREDAKLIKTDAVGSAMARNTGAENSGGDILVFMDAHVFPKSGNWLSEIADELKNEGTGLCGPCIIAFGDESLKGYGMTLKNGTLDVEWLPKKSEESYDVPVLGGACIGIRRPVFERLEGFNKFFENWGYEDMELSIKTWLFGYTVKVIPNIEVYHVFKNMQSYGLSLRDVDANLLKTSLLHFNRSRIRRVYGSLKIRRKGDISLMDALSLRILIKRLVLKRKKRHDDAYFFDKFKIDV